MTGGLRKRVACAMSCDRRILEASFVQQPHVALSALQMWESGGVEEAAAGRVAQVRGSGQMAMCSGDSKSLCSYFMGHL